MLYNSRAMEENVDMGQITYYKAILPIEYIQMGQKENNYRDGLLRSNFKEIFNFIKLLIFERLSVCKYHLKAHTAESIDHKFSLQHQFGNRTHQN